MCGIAGFVGNIDRFALGRARRAMQHRGPDGSGEWISESGFVGLAQTRLAIIGLGEGGRQPMIDRASGCVIVFNGEIYNYRELRASLEARGISFDGASDTEVLLKLLVEEGISAISQLNGMFAFGFWDPRSETLTIARDRFGVKPLFWSAFNGGIVFASETAALTCLSGAGDIDSRGIAKLLFLKYSPSTSTILKNVGRVRPGTALVWCKGRATELRAIAECNRFGSSSTATSFQESAWLVRSAVERGIERQMIADVEVGAFLSGGIDSAITVGVMQRVSSAPLHCFTLVDRDQKYGHGNGELPGALKLAKHLGVQHHVVHCGPAEILQCLRTTTKSLSDPVCEPLLVPSWLLAREAAKHVKVVLSGEGADELFLGYDRYRIRKIAQILGLLPEGARMLLLRSAQRKFGDVDQYSRVLAAINAKMDAITWFQVMHEREVSEITGERNVREELAEELLSGDGEADLVDEMNRIDRQCRLPNFILERADAMTMAHSLEMRPVFLDNEIYSAAEAIPAEHCIGGLFDQSKRALRVAFASGVLPRGYHNRPKVAFSTSMSGWIDELAVEVVNSDLASTSNYWDINAVQRILGAPTNTGRWREKAFALSIIAMWMAERKCT